jgi:TolA-binding protein
MNLNSKQVQEDIEHDAFVDSAVRGYEYFRKNQLTIIVGAVAIGAIVLLGLYFVQSSKLQDARSSVLVNRGTEFMNQEDYASASLWFQKAVDNYSGTAAADEAVYFLGISALRQDNFSEARGFLESYISSHPGNTFLLAAAHAGLASCFEEEDAWADAAKSWAEAGLMHDADNFNASAYLFNAALCYEKSGDMEEVQPLLDRLLEKYPKSSQKTRAELMLERLNAMNN